MERHFQELIQPGTGHQKEELPLKNREVTLTFMDIQVPLLILFMCDLCDLPSITFFFLCPFLFLPHCHSQTNTHIHRQKAQQLNEWVKAVTFLTAYLNNLMSQIVFRTSSIIKTHLQTCINIYIKGERESETDRWRSGGGVNKIAERIPEGRQQVQVSWSGKSNK